VSAERLHVLLRYVLVLLAVVQTLNKMMAIIKKKKKNKMMMLMVVVMRCSCYSADRRLGHRPSLINQLEENSRDRDNAGKSVDCTED